MEYITLDCTVISPQIDPSGTVLSDTKNRLQNSLFCCTYMYIFMSRKSLEGYTRKC